MENTSGNETYQLYNEIGQKIFTGKSIENQDFSGLQKGIYFLEINGETTFKIKLIKQ
ncbi:T9SS type A sorting domain-containing protein [Flavobacterium sp.]|uniref:T9SS type A sorting domain-containing protein n=1 Tax=Flavobacterium sp. TaxID=239 RepID=UPI0037510393